MADTPRDKFAALRDEMIASEKEASAEASELFRSDDMQELLNRLDAFSQRAMPDSHFDNIMRSVHTVITNVRSVFVNRKEQEDKLEEEQAA